MRTSTRIALAAAVFGVTTAGAMVPASAAVPVGGCPAQAGWTLYELSPSATGPLDIGNFKDQNGDGWACYRLDKQKHVTDGGAYGWVWKDNTNPVS